MAETQFALTNCVSVKEKVMNLVYLQQSLTDGKYILVHSL